MVQLWIVLVSTAQIYAQSSVGRGADLLKQVGRLLCLRALSQHGETRPQAFMLMSQHAPLKSVIFTGPYHDAAHTLHSQEALAYNFME